MSDVDVIGVQVAALMRDAADVYLTSSFLQLICLPERMKELREDLEDRIHEAADSSKKRIIDELVKIDAIRLVGGRWEPTDKGREVNRRLERAVNRR